MNNAIFLVMVFSIQNYDLDKFNDKIGIACNHFPFHKDFKKTNVKYAILCEPFYFMPFFDSIVKKRKVQTISSLNPISFHYRKIVKTNPGISFFINLSNYLFLEEKIYSICIETYYQKK